MFRDTFQQYRSLSARLVRSEDGVAALRLWQEYLLNLQAFLSAGLPGDYDALTQHQHQCEVHENLLTSQASVLLGGGAALERGDRVAGVEVAVRGLRKDLKRCSLFARSPLRPTPLLLLL